MCATPMGVSSFAYHGVTWLTRWVHAGRVKGRVVKAPTKTEEQVTQGRLTFQDVGGALRSCSFAADNVRLAAVTVLSKLSYLCRSVSNKTCQDTPFPIACTQNRRMCWSVIWNLWRRRK